MFSLVPYPKQITEFGGETSFPAHIDATFFAPAAETLSLYAARTHGVRFTEGAGGVRFSVCAFLSPEAYLIEITEGGILLSASSVIGAQNAAVTLLQLMRAENGRIVLPLLRIEDAPECTYRSVMIDLARNWHDISMLYEYVDMCRFFKLRYLHFHFTDDQSYTLPSRVFPKLSTEGRHYSEEEIAGLVAYAERRGIEIIPEIDVPGHSTCFSKAYGEIFGEDGIICQNDEAVAGIKALFNELCGYFPHSSYIHMGGDEASVDKWCDCPRCLAAARALGVDPDAVDRKKLADELFMHFLGEVTATIKENGRTPIVWEGFSAAYDHRVPTDVLVMSWEHYYQTPPEFLDGGFTMVNCTWVPLYIVAPGHFCKTEDLYAWNLYRFSAMHVKSPYKNVPCVLEPTDKVIGAQLNAWGDNISKFYPDDIPAGVRREQEIVEERALVLSECVWYREKRDSFEEFSKRLSPVQALYAAFRGKRNG